MPLLVRTPANDVVVVHLHALRLSVSPPARPQLPAELAQHCLSFLPPRDDDWLAADASCRAWRDAAAPLRGSPTRRTLAAREAAARAYFARAFARLVAFRGHGHPARLDLRGPAPVDRLARVLSTLADLWGAAAPRSLPVDVRASLRTHDGQGEGALVGIAYGARLLSCDEICADLPNLRVGLLPIAARARDGRQVCVDMVSGRAVMVRGFSDTAVASSWAKFLNLV